MNRHVVIETCRCHDYRDLRCVVGAMATGVEYLFLNLLHSSIFIVVDDFVIN